VREWHHEDGWGVIDCPEAPGGCWAHFGAVLVPGYRTRRAGQSVELVLEARGQDGYAFRAVEVWPTGQTPVRSIPGPFGPSAAYSSTLHITWQSPETVET
jgi:CspA family cold shock protein